MSAKAQHWAWGQQTDGPADKLVLLALADSANVEGFAYPSLDTVAEMTGASKATVRRAIKRLVDQGFVRVEKRWRDAGGQSSNGYTLLLPEAADDHGSTPPENTETGVSYCNPTGCHNATPPDAHSDTGGVSSCIGGGYQIERGRGTYNPNPLLEPEKEHRARKAVLNFELNGGVKVRDPSPASRASVCQALSIANVDPVLAAYRAWHGSRRARDPSAHFRKAAPTIFARMSAAERELCRPIKPEPEMPDIRVKPVTPSAALLASLNRKGSRYHA